MPEHELAYASAYPAPLVLPGDELSWDPHSKAQTVFEWYKEESSASETRRRKTIYVEAPPHVDGEVRFVRDWTVPRRAKTDAGDIGLDLTRAPAAGDVIDYLAAFYHGMPVKPLLLPLRFTSWNGHDPPTNKSHRKTRSETNTFIGLNNSAELIRVTTRPPKDGLFSRQLNLNDLLDGAISILPEDAYALLMVVHHDLFEDEEDDFACGRAYGGSRVAIVSTARYNPDLDDVQAVPREHAWPASHCQAYKDECCGVAAAGHTRRGNAGEKKRKTAREDDSKTRVGRDSPLLRALSAAVAAHTSSIEPLLTSRRAAMSPAKASSQASLSAHDALAGLWLSRAVRTASHELGHCVGIDHCMYFACNMQGSASVVEDARQPPYVCPVDLEKVLEATGSDRCERDEALLAACDKWAGVSFFDAYAAWLRTLLGVGSAAAGQCA